MQVENMYIGVGSEGLELHKAPQKVQISSSQNSVL